ncbi:MAG: hypothetical protein ACD_9C00214G0004 [uncultured bacterium]|nr:MAG: hypothetical protein ACD_9C00214G0004 [uncultured bacterium]
MKLRKISKLGESTLEVLAAQVGLTANKVQNDETGWDYLLEFPLVSEGISTSLDKVQNPFCCFVQVKATDNIKNPIQIKLSNWLRMILSPQPYFVLIIDFAGRSDCKHAYLVHCGFEIIGTVLKKCRELDQIEKAPPINRVKMAISFSSDNLLPENSGASLRQRILEAIGPSLDKYIHKKMVFQKNVGYEKGNTKFSFEIDKLPGYQDGFEYLMDFALRRIREVECKKISIKDIRFGIEGKEPLCQSTSGGKLILLSDMPDGEGVVALKRSSGKSVEIPLKLYMPKGLSPNFPKLKFRLASRWIEILIPVRKDTSPKIDFKMPLSNEATTLHEVALVAEMVQFLHKSEPNEKLALEILVQGQKIANGEVSFDVKFSELDNGVTKAILDTLRIVQHCKISDQEEVTISQLYDQALTLSLIRKTIENDKSNLMISFDGNQKEVNFEKTFVIPEVQQLFIGKRRIIFAVAIFGRPGKIEPISTNKVRVEMFPCNSKVFQHFVFLTQETVPFSVNDLKEIVAKHYEDTHDILLLES